MVYRKTLCFSKVFTGVESCATISISEFKRGTQLDYNILEDQHQRQQEHLQRAYDRAVKNLLNSNCNPFSVENLAEALAEDDASYIVASALEKMDFDEAGSLLYKITVNYWTQVAELKAKTEPY
jgi:hypothetical protein